MSGRCDAVLYRIREGADLSLIRVGLTGEGVASVLFSENKKQKAFVIAVADG